MEVIDAGSPIDVVRDTLARLRDQLDEQSAADTLQAVQVLLDEITSLRMTAIRLLDAQRRDAPTARQRDTAAELADQLSIGRNEARRAVAGARTLEALPTVAEALDAGEISPAAAEAITRARRQPADLKSLEHAQGDLVELARSAHPDEVAKRARWVVAGDQAQARRRRDHQQANRGVRLRNRDDGLVHIDGSLLPEVGEAWRTILDSLVKASYRGEQQESGASSPSTRQGLGGEDGSRDEDGPPGPVSRSAAQRMHDAFAALGRRILADGLTPDVHGAAAKILVCTDLRTFDPAVHSPELLHALGLDADRIRANVTSMLPEGAGLLPETGALLPVEVVRLLADDGAELVPLIFDGYTPLARGRSLRLADHDLRLGLIARDQGCVDCGAPPAWCDADHDPPWEDGGRTDPDMMELRCRPEHVERHRRLGLDPPGVRGDRPGGRSEPPGGPEDRTGGREEPPRGREDRPGLQDGLPGVQDDLPTVQGPDGCRSP